MMDCIDKIRDAKKPKLVMTIKGPSRRSIGVYDSQPIKNQIMIVRVFMEAERVREELRSRI